MSNEEHEVMTILPLGGGQEVGRSCILLSYQGRQVLLDCGCHPGREGIDSLPFFDSLDDPADVDLVLITHFHIDHCAALPYFTEKTNFKGRVFMTHATKAVMRLLLADNIRLQNNSSPLYTDQDLQNCIDKIEVVDYHETVEMRGIKFTATAAGHVLGAAMFLIDIDNVKVLYTGDYSAEEDRHLIKGVAPAGPPPDVLIVESTFGTTNIAPREKRERDFTTTVENIVTRGGSCLIPVFALGRAQELLLILDEYWSIHPELQNIPIFYASKLATKSLRVYQTFINMMNMRIRDMMDQFRNPFKLSHIRSIQNSDFDVMGPSVVMASPGFLQSGVSRQLFEAWCDDAKNGVIIAGYTVEGTMAADLLSFPTEIKCLDNRIKPRRCQIECIAFAAHVDYNQNKAFIKSTTPDYIILVHGEKTNMRRLKEGLESEMRSGSWPTTHKPSIATPENGTRVRLRFRKHTIANVVGSAVARITNSLDMVKEKNKKESNRSTAIAELPAKSILVTENFTSKLVTAGELSSFTSCKFGRITQRMTIPLPKGLSPAAFRPLAYPTSPPLSEMTFSGESLLEHIESNLEDVFDSLLYCEDANEEVVDVNSHLVGNKCLLVEGLVKIREGFVQENESFRLSHIEVRWSASPIADTIADCCVGMMLQMFSAISLLRHSIQAGHKAIRSKQTKDSMQSKEDKLSGKNVEESIKTEPSPPEHPEANVRSKKRKTTK